MIADYACIPVYLYTSNNLLFKLVAAVRSQQDKANTIVQVIIFVSLPSSRKYRRINIKLICSIIIIIIRWVVVEIIGRVKLNQPSDWRNRCMLPTQEGVVEMIGLMLVPSLIKETLEECKGLLPNDSISDQAEAFAFIIQSFDYQFHNMHKWSKYNLMLSWQGSCSLYEGCSRSDVVHVTWKMFGIFTAILLDLFLTICEDEDIH